MERDRRKGLEDKPVVIVRRKTRPKSAPTGPTQIPSKIAWPVVKAAKPVIPAQPEPVPQPVPPQASTSPAVVETGPSRKERERQARRDLLDVLRDRWPQVFPIDFQQIKPLALGI